MLAMACTPGFSSTKIVTIGKEGSPLRPGMVLQGTS